MRNTRDTYRDSNPQGHLGLRYDIVLGDTQFQTPLNSGVPMPTMNPASRFFVALGVAVLMIGIQFRHDIQVKTTHLFRHLKSN